MDTISCQVTTAQPVRSLDRVVFPLPSPFMLNLFVVFYGFVGFCFWVFPIVLGWLVLYTGDWGGLNLPRGGFRFRYTNGGNALHRC